MNKCVRTKDGRIIDLNSKLVSSYEIIDDNTAKEEYGEDNGFICVYYFDEDIGEHIEYDNKGGRSMDNWYLRDIIKEANTIEELCDVYVLDEKLYYKIEDLKFHIKQLKEWNRWPDYLIKPYGAIWTDKGLIYVAKLNDKGELELL